MAGVRTLTISEEHGVFRVTGLGRVLGTGLTLEKALATACAGAPEEYVFGAAEILLPLLGEKNMTEPTAVTP